MQGEALLFRAQGFIDGDGPAFADLHRPFGRLITIHAKRHGVQARRHLHASRCELRGGGSVHEDLRSLWVGVHLCPGDPRRRLLVQGDVELRLDVVFDLDASGVSFKPGHAQDEVEMAGCERQRYRGLPRLFGSVDKDIGARPITVHVDYFS